MPGARGHQDQVPEDKRPEVSDEAIRRATGRDWAQWRSLLDARGAQALSHAEIARLLQAEGLVSSGWWCQAVTVGYERLLGRRVVGETTEGFKLGVQGTLPLPVERAWALLSSPAGLSAWLGPGATLPDAPGQPWRAADGTTGELRARVPGVRLRLSWQPPGRATPTTLQLSLEGRKSGTAVRFDHERLADAAERDAMRTRWKAALQALRGLAATG